MKIFCKQQKKEFDCKYYYFCLISEASQRISVTIRFGEISNNMSHFSPIPTSPRKKKQGNSLDILKSPQLLEQISKKFLTKSNSKYFLEYIKRKRLEKMIKISLTNMNKVEFNKSQTFTTFSPEIQNKIRYRKKQEIQQKVEKVEMRKAMHDEYQLNKRHFEIIKHDLAKNCMDYYRNLQNQLNHINAWKRSWISIIFFTLIEKKISQYTNIKYNEKKKLLQMAFGLQKFQIRFRKRLRDIGEDQDERIKTETKGYILIIEL